MQLFDGHHEAGVAMLDRLIAQDPKFPEGYHLKGYSQLLRRDYTNALATLEQAVACSHRAGWPVAKMGCALAGLGRTTEALRLLAELEERFEADPLCPAAVATLHLHLGHRDAFYRWMDRALDDREPFCVALNVERLWEAAWGDEAYRALVRRVGLTAQGR